MAVANDLRRRADAGSGKATLPTAAHDDELVALMLDEAGLVRECNPAGEEFFGYRRAELLRQHVSKVLPQLGAHPLLENGRLDSLLLFRCRIGGCFHALIRSGDRIAVDLYISDLGSRGSHRLRVLVRPAERMPWSNSRAVPAVTGFEHLHPNTPISARDGESA